MILGLGPEEWSAIAAAVTALVALFAAIFIPIQVREAKRLREEQAQPFVVADFQPSAVWSNIINLVVENVGKTLARDVRLTFDPPLASTHATGKWDLNDTALIKKGIPTMPPGRQVVALFDLSHDRHKSNLPMEYRVKVEFSDSRGRGQSPLEYLLDLSYFYGLQGIREYGLHDAAKALREIEKTVNKWTEHFNGLRVYTRDGDQRDAELREEDERRRNRRSQANRGTKETDETT